jgi:hypothetical protein
VRREVSLYYSEGSAEASANLDPCLRLFGVTGRAIGFPVGDVVPPVNLAMVAATGFV